MSSFFKDIREIVDPKFVLSEEQIVELVEEKFTSTNSKSIKSLCDSCENTQCTYPEKRCYKTIISDCSSHK